MQYTNRNSVPLFPVYWVDRPAENVYEEAKANEANEKFNETSLDTGVRIVQSILSVLSDRGFR